MAPYFHDQSTQQLSPSLVAPMISTYHYHEDASAGHADNSNIRSTSVDLSGEEATAVCIKNISSYPYRFRARHLNPFFVSVIPVPTFDYLYSCRFRYRFFMVASLIFARNSGSSHGQPLKAEMGQLIDLEDDEVCSVHANSVTR